MTEYVKNSIDNIKDEHKLIEYIVQNQCQLSRKNATAKENLRKLKDEALIIAQKERKGTYRGYTGRYRDRLHTNSMNFLFETIIMQPTLYQGNPKEKNTTDEEYLGTCTVFGKNARLRESIKHNFPEAAKLNEKALEKLNSDEIRKLIILLYSYNEWSINPYIPLYVYQNDLNNFLDESGLPLLYEGNAYDCVFLYCTLKNSEENPLTTFRNIIDMALFDENNDDLC